MILFNIKTLKTFITQFYQLLRSVHSLDITRVSLLIYLYLLTDNLKRKIQLEDAMIIALSSVQSIYAIEIILKMRNISTRTSDLVGSHFSQFIGTTKVIGT